MALTFFTTPLGLAFALVLCANFFPDDEGAGGDDCWLDRDSMKYLMNFKEVKNPDGCWLDWDARRTILNLGGSTASWRRVAKYINIIRQVTIDNHLLDLAPKHPEMDERLARAVSIVEETEDWKPSVKATTFKAIRELHERHLTHRKRQEEEAAARKKKD